MSKIKKIFFLWAFLTYVLQSMGNEHKAPVGIQNLKNTCYFNSALQLLNKIPNFRQHLHDIISKKEAANKNDPTVPPLWSLKKFLEELNNKEAPLDDACLLTMGNGLLVDDKMEFKSWPVFLKDQKCGDSIDNQQSVQEFLTYLNQITNEELLTGFYLFKPEPNLQNIEESLPFMLMRNWQFRTFPAELPSQQDQCPTLMLNEDHTVDLHYWNQREKKISPIKISMTEKEIQNYFELKELVDSKTLTLEELQNIQLIVDRTITAKRWRIEFKNKDTLNIDDKIIPPVLVINQDDKFTVDLYLEKNLPIRLNLPWDIICDHYPSLTTKGSKGLNSDVKIKKYILSLAVNEKYLWFNWRREANRKIRELTKDGYLLLSLAGADDKGNKLTMGIDKKMQYKLAWEDFDVFACVLHSTSFESKQRGHYTALVKNDNGKWYLVNDSSVTPITSPNCTSASEVLLKKRSAR